MHLQNLIWQRVWRLVALGLCSLLWVGCGFFDDPIDKANQIIDNGTADINRNSALWAGVLQNVADELPDEIAETVREEAQTLATRSVAQAGTEFKCSVDFLARRAKEELQRLKQMLINQKPDPLPPAFCLVAPADIDLNTDPSSWDTITLHGYDLDHEDSSGNIIRFAMTQSDGQLYNLLKESAVGRTTHYQITLNLRNVADRFHDQEITKIVPRWEGILGGTTSGEVVVKAWRPQRDTRHNYEPNITTWTPPRVNGDKDFDTGGNDPRSVNAQAEISVSPQIIKGRVHMWARESKGDHTEVKGWSPWDTLYESPSGWKIMRVIPRTTSKLPTVQITSRGKHTYNRPSGEVVTRFNVWGDHKGDDAGGYTKIEADWSLLQIELEEIQPSWYRP